VSDDHPPAPPALPFPVTDNHTHLDSVRGGEPGTHPADAEVAEQLAAARAVGVTRVVQIGCDLPAARWTVRRTGPGVLGGVALHPTEATKHAAAGDFEAAMAEIEELATHPGIGVVGETGLDHYWVPDDAGRRAQEVSFRRHIDLAKRLDKVLQIHDRDAHDDVLRVLAAEGAPERTVLHCFSGDAAMARHCADRGWYLSFAGPLTFKNAGPLRAALLAVPFEQVLVETDAPYLTPAPFRGRVNGSRLLPYTVRAMAELTGRDLEATCAALAENSERLYGVW
jgi:TatD DNase family protein